MLIHSKPRCHTFLSLANMKPLSSGGTERYWYDQQVIPSFAIRVWCGCYKHGHQTMNLLRKDVKNEMKFSNGAGSGLHTNVIKKWVLYYTRQHPRLPGMQPQYDLLSDKIHDQDIGNNCDFEICLIFFYIIQETSWFEFQYNTKNHCPIMADQQWTIGCV